MKLLLYGGGDHEDTLWLDKRLIQLSSRTSPKITFIPSYSYDADIDFQDFVLRFSRLGVRRFINFPVDIPYDDTLLEEAFSSDIIYLDGGNTFYFLNHLRKSKILHRIKKYVESGGVLAGLSAGAILMTPDISTAGFPDFDCDENYDKIRNFKALNLVPFEFFPHYKNSKRYNDALLEYSLHSERQLIACADGHGVIIKNGEMELSHSLTFFYKGKKIKKTISDYSTLFLESIN